MTTPFVYRVTFIDPITQQRRWYIGVKYARGCTPADLWSSYFTSSGEIKKLLAEHGPTRFSTKIVRTFASKQEAMNFEARFIRRCIAMGLGLNNALINKSIPTSAFPTITGEYVHRGKKYSEFMRPEAVEHMLTILKRPKSRASIEKGHATRIQNNSYRKGAKHHLARTFLIISPDGQQHEITGGLKQFCADNNLSWQTLYSHIDEGPIVLDRARYKNLTRLTDRFWNSIGWEIRAAVR